MPFHLLTDRQQATTAPVMQMQSSMVARTADESAEAEDAAVIPSPRGGRKWFFAASFISLLLCLGHWPLLHKFLIDLGTRDQYGFWPLVVIAAVALAWERTRDLSIEQVKRGSPAIVAAMLAASLGCLVIGATFYMRWFAGPAAWITLAAIVYAMGGVSLTRALLPVGVLLLVIIPPPFHMDDVQTRWLQRQAVTWSSGLLDLIRVPHLLSGTVIDIPGHRLLVEEACSGINSLMAVLAFTLLLAFFRHRSAGKVLLLVLASAWFVFCANITRIALGAVLQTRFNISILDGSMHELSALAIFAVSLALVASADQLLVAVSDRMRPARASRESERIVTEDMIRRSSPKWLWWSAAVAFVAVGMFTQLRTANAWPQPRLPGNLAFTPPTDIGAWKKLTTDERYRERTETFGKYSYRWVYQQEDLTAEVSFAYPFTETYHDAIACYLAAGWSIDRPSHLAPWVADNPTKPFYELEFKRNKLLGYLLFGDFDEAGRWHKLPGAVPNNGGVSGLIKRSRDVAAYAPTHEVQTLVVSSHPLTAEQRAQVEMLFDGVRTSIAAETVRYLQNIR